MKIFLKALKIIGIGAVSLLGIILVEMAIAVFAPGISAPDQPIAADRTAAEIPEPPEYRENINFKVGDDNLSGWLYLPEKNSQPAPCVVMTHGFGGTKDLILEKYAVRYREAGLATLSFDYRHFGESDGEPRQYFSMAKQLEDLKAAVAYTRQRPEIQADKIAIWGTSAGGGYGLILAAGDKRIACVVCQCPALDAEEDEKMAVARDGIGFFLRLFVHAQRDKGRSRFGMAPYTIPIVGKPGTLAMITAPGAFDGYQSIVSASSSRFINQVCARILLEGQGYNPVDYAPDVECPVLLHICERDNLVSPASYRKTAEILGSRAQVSIFPIGHFDIYLGEHFEKAVAEQVVFFYASFNITSD